MKDRNDVTLRSQHALKLEYENALKAYISYVKNLSRKTILSKNFIFEGADLREKFVKAEIEFRKTLLLDRFNATQDPNTSSVAVDIANQEYLKHNIHFIYILLQTESILTDILKLIPSRKTDLTSLFTHELQSIQNLVLNAHKLTQNLNPDYPNLFKEFSAINNKINQLKNTINNLEEKLDEYKKNKSISSHSLQSMIKDLEIIKGSVIQLEQGIYQNIEVSALDQIILNWASVALKTISSQLLSQKSSSISSERLSEQNSAISCLNAIMQIIITSWSNLAQSIDSLIQVFRRNGIIQDEQSLTDNKSKQQQPSTDILQRERLFSDKSQSSRNLTELESESESELDRLPTQKKQ